MDTISITKPNSSDTNWGDTINTALDAIVSKENEIIGSVNANPSNYAGISHVHVGTDVNVTYQTQQKTVQYAIDNMMAMLSNFSTGAVISSITTQGETNVSNFVVHNIMLSKLCFPFFQIYWFWSIYDNDVSGFGSPQVTMSPSLAVLKPATGYDANNKIYLHCKFQLFNPDGTQSGYDVVTHTHIDKWQGNFTVDEIAVALTNNDDFVNSAVGSLSGSNLLASKVGGIINARLQ